MNLLNFCEWFPDEDSCRNHWINLRLKHGVVCKKCQGEDYWWLASKLQFECKSCGFRTTLRSGTVMESSKLPYRYWYVAFHLVTSTKKSISALELQRQIGHKRYEPIWALLHKLRCVMGKVNSQKPLDGVVELDEGFFETAYTAETNPVTGQKESLKRGRGSQRQAKVMVMTSTRQTPPEKQKKYRPKVRLEYARMVVMENLNTASVDNVVGKCISTSATAITDGFKSYRNLKKLLQHHWNDTQPEAKHNKGLPVLHTVISNAKRLLLGIFHSVGPDYLQNYLDEFCFKLNERYHRDKIFDRLVVAGVKTSWY